jgi:hypothetical protein
MDSPAIPVKGKEDFIAVVFGNEVWMGLVDFKSDKPKEEVDEEFGMSSIQWADLVPGDGNRSSTVIVSKTFSTPASPPPMRTYSPRYKEEERPDTTYYERTVVNDYERKGRGEYERKVEFDIRKSQDGALKLRGMVSPTVEANKENVKTVETRKEKKQQREVRQGHAPPISVLHGYRNTLQQPQSSQSQQPPQQSQHPKSILKRTDSSSPKQSHSAGISATL